MALTTKSRLEKEEVYEAETKMLQQFTNDAAAEHLREPMVHALGSGLQLMASKDQQQTAIETKRLDEKPFGSDSMSVYVRSASINCLVMPTDNYLGSSTQYCTSRLRFN